MNHQLRDSRNARTSKVAALGDFVRSQRRKSQMSLRQLSDLTGVSNPYLSQVERGLRKPSVEVLQQIARALHLSADVLYVQAGILQERPVSAGVPEAISQDPRLSRPQRLALTQMYWTFVGESADGDHAENGQSDSCPDEGTAARTSHTTPNNDDTRTPGGDHA